MFDSLFHRVSPFMGEYDKLFQLWRFDGTRQRKTVYGTVGALSGNFPPCVVPLNLLIFRRFVQTFCDRRGAEPRQRWNILEQKCWCQNALLNCSQITLWIMLTVVLSSGPRLGSSWIFRDSLPFMRRSDFSTTPSESKLLSDLAVNVYWFLMASP